MNNVSKLMIILIFFLPLPLLFADPAPNEFKHFSDFTDMTPTKGSQPGILRAHYNAKLKVNDQPYHPMYKNKSWKLVMRRGLYRAQVEKAMAEMDEYFLGYSTHVEIVEENGDYYIARRELRHYIRCDDSLIKQNNKYYVNGYELLDDGTLIKGNARKHFSGLASIAVLTRFFRDTDAQGLNYGVQELDDSDQLTVVDYDLEHGLDLFMKDGPAHDMENDLKRWYGPELIAMSWYQAEKQAMLKKIAATDFSVIESILRKNITVSRLEEGRWFLNRILKDPTVFIDMNRENVRKQLEALNKLDEQQYDINRIIAILKRKHNELRKRLGYL